MGKINADWHRLHPMGKANTEQRLAWHLEHARNCACRDMPESIRAEIERRKAGAAASIDRDKER